HRRRGAQGRANRVGMRGGDSMGQRAGGGAWPMVIVGHGDLLLEMPRAQIRNRNFIRDPRLARARAQIAGARVEGRREREPTAARAPIKNARKSVARIAALACALAIAGCAAGAPPAPAPLM